MYVIAATLNNQFMKKTTRLFLSAILLASIASCKAQQEETSSFNLNFETVENDNPKGWKVFGGEGYETYLDTTNAKEGKNSVVIQNVGRGGDFRAWAYEIPAKYKGKTIKLTGYVKTENVTDGYAGLWMRLDPNAGFDNMRNRGITGTSDWKKYTIRFHYKSTATQIVVGGLLVGKGKMWIDDLKVTIDGSPLEKATLKDPFPAELDKEFDEGSKVTNIPTDETTLKNLEFLGRVWGFLKYHHPALAQGKHNWDYELFRVMPKIIEAKNTLVMDQVLTSWIDSLGAISECDPCAETDPNAVIKPNVSWMEDTNISSKLRAKLKEVYINRATGDHYYISAFTNVNNPEFKNEMPYTDMVYPDAGFRVLSLFRYWNMIRYYFPYTDILDKDWNTVLLEYLPRFINAEDEITYEIAALQLIGDVQDTHANLWGGADQYRATHGSKFPPVHVRFIDKQLVVFDHFNDEMKHTSGLKAGDIITSIDGMPVNRIIEEELPFYPASNLPSKLRDLSMNILRSDKDAVQITVKNESGEKEQQLDLYNKEVLNYYRWYRKNEGPSHKWLDENIGYVNLSNITQDDTRDIIKEYKNAKGIIVDIRNYPSTFVVFSLGKFFVPKGIDFVKFSKMNLGNPGEFSFTSPLSNGKNNENNVFQGKLVILINETSQSQAEYTAMALRAAPNATVIGSTTAGADGNISSILLPGGLSTAISGIGVFYPDGTPTQRVGIVPDIEMKPTVEGVRQGKDELLEKAISVINQ